MLDVHSPHEPVHGTRDFFIHLFTITIGLLIALSLEGLVEWQHHRHLVHDAETSLHAEITNNAHDMQDALDGLRKEQGFLAHDVEILKLIKATHKTPEHGSMEISFGVHDFESVSWKTAQVSTAISYMPYDHAQEYSDIYDTQAVLAEGEQQAARDTILAIAPFANSGKDDPPPAPEQAQSMLDKIQILQSQLVLVETFMKNLDGQYKKFLDAHKS